jgi:hypothetical protein
MRLAHLLGQIGIFDGGEAVAAFRAGQPEIPQAALSCGLLQPFEDFALARTIDPAVACLAHLAQEFLVERHDLVAHHGRDARVDRLQPLGHAEIHLRHRSLTLHASQAFCQWQG